MKKYMVMMLIFLISSCSTEDIAKSFSPLYPKKARTHIVELYKLQISEFDFNLSSFGNPLQIKISLFENGKEIKSSLLSGKRGERKLKKPVQWLVNFNPASNYQITIKEQALIADAVVWKLPATPKIGLWPIAIDDGAIKFGRDSILYFRDKIAK